MTDYRNIFKNKPKSNRPFVLSLRAEPGIWRNDEFTTECAYRFDDIALGVQFGDAVLISQHRFKSAKIQQWHFSLQDSPRRSLDLILKLSKQNFYSQTDDHGMDPRLIHLSVDIEGFCIDYFIENKLCYYVQDQDIKMGSCLMGESGEIRFPVSMPIYRWIFQNEHEMEKRYQSIQKP